MRAAAIVATAVVLATAPAHAVVTGVPWLHLAPVPPARSRVAPAALTMDAARAVALRNDGYGYVELLQRNEVLFRANGMVETTLVHVRHFLTDDGVRAGGNIVFSVLPAWETAELLEAWALLPNGERAPLDLSAVQVTSPPQGELFSDVREVTLPFARIIPGSSAVIVLRTLYDRRKFPLRWAEHLMPQGLVPHERFEVHVRYESDKAPLTWAANDPALACHEGRRELVCERTRIPAAVLEADMGSWADRVPHVVIAEPQTWEQLAATERELVRPGIDTADPDVQALARKLVAGAATPAERFARLHRFVADQIRYMGIETGTGAVVPRPASVTLRRGFGDCKDKVTLLLALAKLAGVPAEPVLVATGRRDESGMLLPSPRYFDHMIACAFPDGRPVCVDPTVPGQPTGEIPLGLRDCLALPLEGPTQMFRLAAPDPAFVIATDVTVKLGCDGTVDEVTTRRYGGAGGAVVRAQLRASTQADRRRQLEESYARVMGAGRKPEITVPDLDLPGPSVEIRSRVRLPGRADLARTPQLREPDWWLVEYAQSSRTRNRVHPYRNPGLRLTSRVTYQLCPEMTVRFVGPQLRFAGEFGSLARDYQKTADQVTVETRVEVPAREVPTDALARYDRFLEAALAETHIWFAQAPRAAGARR